tara:strand:- start:2388 stop:3356 length:969 start_codon:yes stop_codon:yes gene_type:complete
MEEEKISQETEPTEEVRAGNEEQPSEGYSHLTQADLDPDYKPTEKETEVDNTESIQAEQSENAVMEDKSKDSPSKVDEYQINGTTYKDGDLNDRMVKDYKNLASHTGKQAEEIGKYKAKVEELQKQMEAETTPNKTSEMYGDKKLAGDTPKTNKSYDVFTEKGLKELSRDMAREVIEQKQAGLKKEEQKKTVEEIANEASKTFIKNHNLKDDAYVGELVQYSQEKGYQLQKVESAEQVAGYLEHLHAMKTGDYSKLSNETVKKSDSKVDSTTMEKVSEGQKVQKGLGNVNSSDADNVDYDNMSFDDWEKLPRDKRNQLLGIN